MRSEGARRSHLEELERDRGPLPQQPLDADAGLRRPRRTEMAVELPGVKARAVKRRGRCGQRKRRRGNRGFLQTPGTVQQRSRDGGVGKGAVEHARAAAYDDLLAGGRERDRGAGRDVVQIVEA